MQSPQHGRTPKGPLYCARLPFVRGRWMSGHGLNREPESLGSNVRSWDLCRVRVYVELWGQPRSWCGATRFLLYMNLVFREIYGSKNRPAPWFKKF
jgi:hypothetical protein